jgi:hypothetical protein
MTTSNVNVPLNQDWTKVYILLDKSGSMFSLNPENTSKQVTGLVHEQTGGRVSVTAVAFSDSYHKIRDNVNGKDFNINAEDIRPDGSTALQESLCRLIDEAGVELSNMTDERPGKVVFIVLTDGEENASQGEYAGEPGRHKLAEKIKHQQEVYNWLFYFLGTNIDAIKVGTRYGIDQRTCINYHSSQQGCTNVMRTTSYALNRVRFSMPTPVGVGRDEMMNTAGFTQTERFVSIRADDASMPLSQPLTQCVSNSNETF